MKVLDHGFVELVSHTGNPQMVTDTARCSTGSTALYLARQAVESGAVDCALAFGFEQMPAGAIKNAFDDRIPPLARFLDVAREYPGLENAPKNLPIVGLLFGALFAIKLYWANIKILLGRLLGKKYDEPKD